MDPLDHKFRALYDYDSEMKHSKLLYIEFNSRVYRLLSVKSDDYMITWTITGQGKGVEDFDKIRQWVKNEWLPIVGITEQLKTLPHGVAVQYKHMTSHEAQALWPFHSMEMAHTVSNAERNAPGAVLRSCLYIYEIKFGTTPARIHYDSAPVESITI